MNALFSLIHSLSPSEKRYFKLFAQRQVQTKSTNYAKLFDAINEQEFYCEADLLKKFRKENFVKQFAVTKHYLFQMILKSMEEYNEETFAEWKIRNQYLQIKILASKGLDAEAEKLIHKTKEMAWQHELYNVILDVIDIEKYLYGNFRIGSFTFEAFEFIQKEETKASTIIVNYQQLRNVWHQLTLLELKMPTESADWILAQAKNFVSVNCMQQEPAISFNSKFRYYSTWSLYYSITNNQIANYDCCKKAIEIRENQILAQPWLNLDPLASYYNFLIACEKANKWDDFTLYLNKIKEYKATTIEVNIRRMHNYCWCGLMYCLHLNKLNEAKAIIAEYKSFFIDKQLSFREDFKIYIEAACGLVCFFNKEYHQALHWWSYIINNPPAKVEHRTQGAVRLYTLMLHVEEQNSDVVEYVANQAKNFLKQHQLFKQPEQLVIKGLKHIAQINDRKAAVDAFAVLYNQLLHTEFTINGNAFNQFMLQWVKSKLA